MTKVRTSSPSLGEEDAHCCLASEKLENLQINKDDDDNNNNGKVKPNNAFTIKLKKVHLLHLFLNVIITIEWSMRTNCKKYILLPHDL